MGYEGTMAHAGPTIHVLAGPTASGKSARALALAGRHGGRARIINADSVQLYDALPLLSARPTARDMACAPHALYGVLDPGGPACSAGNWRELALPLIARALADGQAPIVVGGSGLYLAALLHGLSPVPDIPQAVRNEAAARRAALGAEAFFEEVRALDPAAAAPLHPGHSARVLRVWEVRRATGRTLTDWRAAPRDGPPAHWSFAVEVLMPARADLYARCDARFLEMLRGGAWDEARAFEAAVRAGRLPEGCPPSRALGLRELRACVRGEVDEATAIARAQAATRHYAKRQVTWLRHQLRAGPGVDVRIVG
jgi:tRNA dimethylallyltransferase